MSNRQTMLFGVEYLADIFSEINSASRKTTGSIHSQWQSQAIRQKNKKFEDL